MVAVDMTRSNGDPRSRGSLHAVESDGSPGEFNEYVPVLRSILEALENTVGTGNMKIPLFGFGAKLPPSRTCVSHCFSLKGDYFHPQLSGVDEVIEAYRQAVDTVVVNGPTRFSEIFKVGSEWAQSLVGSSGYLILLVVTDGSMTDFRETVDILVPMSKLPASIVIVGVGDSDFSNMDRLDADKHPLVSDLTGESVYRDIVQFVRYHDHTEPSSLVEAALAEVPRQLTEYFSEHGVRRTILESEPKFLSDQMTSLLVTIHNQGYEEDIAERLVNEFGVFSPDPLHVIDVMFFHKRRMALAWTSDPRDLKQRSLGDRFGVAKQRPKELGAAPQHRLLKSTKQLGHRDRGTCRVCFTNHIDTVIQPCGHEIVCIDCSTKIGRLCPLCRNTIDSIIGP